MKLHEENEAPYDKGAASVDDGNSGFAFKKSRLRRIGSLCWACFMLGVFVLIGFQLGGLLRYAHVVTTPATPIENKVDGIVVLTGGENRIRAAMGLLSAAKADRLLITGVNPTLSEDFFKKSLHIDDALFECCVDIDRSARDTIGNALATRQWVDKTGAKSLVVVTGAFHMPRALKEFSHALEGVELIASPVNVPRDNKWLRDHSRLRDMLREYGKLMFVSLRDYINMWTGKPWPTMPMRHAYHEKHLYVGQLSAPVKSDAY